MYAATTLELGKAYRCRRCGHATRYRGVGGTTSIHVAAASEGSDHHGSSGEVAATLVESVREAAADLPLTASAPGIEGINLDPAEDSAFINISDDPRAAVSFDDPPRPPVDPASSDSNARDAADRDDWLMSGFDQEAPTAPADSIPRKPAATVTPDVERPKLALGITRAPSIAAPLPPKPEPRATPRTFGRYEIVEEIGRGGMGIVYKARDPKLDRFVAIKTLIGGNAANQAAIKRFEREARTIARLQHPCIVPIHEYGEIDGTRFLVMEFVEGRTLLDLAKGERGNTRTSLALMSKVARALDYAHEQGIVHRDLKPANVMIDTRREPRVMDFGLAKDLDGSQSMLSQTGDLMGTPNYMAPEQADGRIHEVDRLSDVFSLGAMLYELLTGSPPFHGASLAETLRQVLFEDPPPMRTLNPKVDPEVERIALKALEKDRSNRYPSAGALADDIDRFLQGAEISVAAPSVLTRVTKTVKRKRAWAAPALAVVVVAAAAAGGLAFWFRDPLGGAAERLSSKDPEVRRLAIETLAADRRTGRLAAPKLAQRAYALLGGALRDPSPAVRLVATQSLASWRDALPRDAEQRRADLARTLEMNLDIDAPPELRHATLDLIEALHLTDMQDALKLLVTDLREDQSLTLHAVRTLGAVGKLSAFPALMQVLYRGGVYRIEAQAAIDRLAAPRASDSGGGADAERVSIAELPSALRNFERDVAGNRAREIEALEGLGMAPSPARDADVTTRMLREGNATQRLTAVYRMSQQRVPGADKLLLAAISDLDPSVSQAAATALVGIAGDSARDDLEKVLATGGAHARAAAASGLRQLAKTESLDPLVVALDRETDASATVEICLAIATIGNKRAAAHVIEKLSSPEPRVARAAHQTLTRLAGEDLGDDPARWRAWASTD
ncbi:MAG: protein kinase [bacterium]